MIWNDKTMVILCSVSNIWSIQTLEIVVIVEAGLGQSLLYQLKRILYGWIFVQQIY